MKLRILAVVGVVLIVCLSGLVLAQDNPPAGRPSLVECVEGENIPCVRIVTDVSEIAGLWRRYFNGGTDMAFTVFTEDGEFGIAFDPDAEPFIGGSITFEDGLASIAAYPNPNANPAGTIPGVYELHLIRVGEQPVALAFLLIDDDFTHRIADFALPMIYYTDGAVAELED